MKHIAIDLDEITKAAQQVDACLPCGSGVVLVITSRKPLVWDVVPSHHNECVTVLGQIES